MASLSHEIGSVDAWVDAADAACYAAKAAGRGVVRAGRPPRLPQAPNGNGSMRAAGSTPDSIED